MYPSDPNQSVSQAVLFVYFSVGKHIQKGSKFSEHKFWVWVTDQQYLQAFVGQPELLLKSSRKKTNHIQAPASSCPLIFLSFQEPRVQEEGTVVLSMGAGVQDQGKRQSSRGHWEQLLPMALTWKEIQHRPTTPHTMRQYQC